MCFFSKAVTVIIARNYHIIKKPAAFRITGNLNPLLFKFVLLKSAQLREGIVKKSHLPINALIRSFWYSHIKPTLFRADALAGDFDQYKQLSTMLTRLVRFSNVMRYRDMGFIDDSENSRKVGINYHVILFSEKEGK